MNPSGYQATVFPQLPNGVMCRHGRGWAVLGAVRATSSVAIGVYAGEETASLKHETISELPVDMQESLSGE